MFGALDISTSALTAQRVRLNAISANIANMSTTRNEAGAAEPYLARHVVFQTDDELTTAAGGSGVKVSSIELSQKPPILKYEPGHPDADENGMVSYPNINMTREFVDAMEATRSYQANIGMMDMTKNMAQQTLRILA